MASKKTDKVDLKWEKKIRQEWEEFFDKATTVFWENNKKIFTCELRVPPRVGEFVVVKIGDTEIHGRVVSVTWYLEFAQEHEGVRMPDERQISVVLKKCEED